MFGRGASGLLAVAVVSAVVAAPAGARERHPSAEELWRQYPLGTAQPAGAATAAPAPSRTPTRRVAAAAERDGGGVDAAWFVAAALVALAGVPAWMLFGPIGRRREAPTGPPAGAEQAPERRSAQLLPQPDEEWTAEIVWQRRGAEGTFAVLARHGTGAPRTLAQTAPLEWPPPDAGAVQAMTDAAQALEVSMLDDGWEPLEPGEGWYAKRFARRQPSAAPTRSVEHTSEDRRAADAADVV